MMPAWVTDDTTVDVDIAVYLKKSNKVFRIEKHVHNYPHCWRTDKPVLYYPLDAWFIKDHRVKGQADRTEQYHQLETGIHRIGPFRQMAGKPGRLESFAFALLGHSAAGMGESRHMEYKCIGSVQELKDEIDKVHQGRIYEE